MRRALRSAHFIFFILFCMALANITQALEIDVGHLSTRPADEPQALDSVRQHLLTANPVDLHLTSLDADKNYARDFLNKTAALFNRLRPIGVLHLVTNDQTEVDRIKLELEHGGCGKDVIVDRVAQGDPTSDDYVPYVLETWAKFLNFLVTTNSVIPGARAVARPLIFTRSDLLHFCGWLNHYFEFKIVHPEYGGYGPTLDRAFIDHVHKRFKDIPNEKTFFYKTYWGLPTDPAFQNMRVEQILRFADNEGFLGVRPACEALL